MAERIIHVLLIEDNPTDALIVREALGPTAGLRFVVTLAERLAEGLQRLKEGPCDVILLDLNLPDSTGFATFARLREATSAFPIIVVTEQVEAQLAAKAVQAGAQDYLIKGNTEERLLPRAIRYAIDRKRNTEALRLMHVQLRQLLDHSPAVIYAWKLEGEKPVPYLVSENILTLLGFTVPETVGQEWWQDQIHPNDRVRAVDSVAETILAGTSRTEYRLRHKDGHYCWIDDTRRLARDAHGAPMELIGLWTDITERKRTEDALQQASTQAASSRWKAVAIEFAVLIGSTAIFYALSRRFAWLEAVARWSLYGGVEQLDDVAASALFLAVGMGIFAFRRWRETKSELIVHQHGQAALRLLHDELNQRVNQRTQDLANLNQTLRTEITARTDVEKALQRFRALMDQSNDTLEVIDPESGRFLDINERGCAAHGYTRIEYLALRVSEIDPTVGAAGWPKVRDELRLHGSHRGEGRHRRKDGTTFPVEVSSKWVRLDRDYIVTMVRDITERKQGEEQLLHAQRVENIGLLAAGVAHDLNNILAPMLMAASMLQTHVTDESDLRLLVMMEKSAQRGAALVRQILGFAHVSGGEQQLLQMKHLLRDIASIITETFPKALQFVEEVDGNLWTIRADTTQIHQVLLNLCINARDAMPAGGTLTLRAGNCRLDEAAARAIEGASPGVWLRLEVGDTGTGIPPAVLARIWEPFFTTKAPGKGTGLGLSTVRGIVERHLGFVTVQTAAGQGTTFTVYLPAAEGAPEAENPAPAVSRGAGELVLIVDDEEAIRDVTTGILTHHNYRVLVANDGIEGVGLIAKHGLEIRLVITDFNMPGLSGDVLARVARSLNPTIKIIGMSGGDESRQVATTDPYADVFLAKPFKAETLLNEVQRLLQPPAAKS
jgi:PAS domain S-box-containing protein